MQILVTRRITADAKLLRLNGLTVIFSNEDVFDNSQPIFIAFQIGVPHFDEFVAKAGKLHSTLK